MDLKIHGESTCRCTFENHYSTRFSREEYVGVKWSFDVWMHLENRCHRLGLVGREVVEDHIEPLIVPAGRDHGAEEAHEVLTRMPGRRVALDLTDLDVQRSLEQRRAVSLAAEPLLLDAIRRERQHAIAAVARLDGGLLVDAEHCGVMGQVEVEAAAVGRGRLEVRVVRGYVTREPMGLQVGFAPDALHDVLADVQGGGRAAAGTVRRPDWRLPPSGRQHPATHTAGQLPGRAPGIVARQAVHAPLQEPPAAPRGGRARDVEHRGHGSCRNPTRQKRQDRRAPHEAGRQSVREARA